MATPGTVSDVDVVDDDETTTRCEEQTNSHSGERRQHSGQQRCTKRRSDFTLCATLETDGQQQMLTAVAESIEMRELSADADRIQASRLVEPTAAASRSALSFPCNYVIAFRRKARWLLAYTE